MHLKVPTCVRSHRRRADVQGEGHPVQKSGSKLVSTRTYTGCEKGKPQTRAQHHRGGSKAT
jgi:hypothetical protein